MKNINFKSSLTKRTLSCAFSVLPLLCGASVHEEYFPALESVNYNGAIVTTNLKSTDGPLAYAFDGRDYEKWGSYTPDFYLTIEFPSAYAFTQLDLKTIGWNDGARDRSPEYLAVWGSNDNKEWDELYPETKCNLGVISNTVTNFKFENNTEYKYYKLNLKRTTSNLISLGEITFPEYTNEKQDISINGNLNLWSIQNKYKFKYKPVEANHSTITFNIPLIDVKETEFGVIYSKDKKELIYDSEDLKKIGSKGSIGNDLEKIYSVTIDNLDPSTTYYIRPYAINKQSNNIYYDNVYEISTSDIENSNLNITVDNNNTYLHKAVVKNTYNNVSYKERGIVFGETSNPNIDNSYKTISGSNDNVFELEACTPKSNTTLYYVRPYYIDNNNNVKYGNQIAFYSIAEFHWWEDVFVESHYTSESWDWNNNLSKAFNGKLTDNYTSPAANAQIVFTFPNEKNIKKYVLATGNDKKRQPKEWVLYGSDDKMNWQTVHSVNLDPNDEASENKGSWAGEKTFNFENNKSYPYYKLHVSKTMEANDPVMISKIEFPSIPLSIDKEADTENDFDVYMNNNKVYVINNSGKMVSVNIYNTLGSLVNNVQSNETKITIDNFMTKGIYIVNVTSGDNKYSKKVIIK